MLNFILKLLSFLFPRDKRKETTLSGEPIMGQIVWQVRKKGKYYGAGNSTDVEQYSPYPFDEYVGTDLPVGFEGDVVRRVVFDVPKYATNGWIPHMSQREYMEMYSGDGDAQ